MDKGPSALERVWSIPTLHDAIISLVPPECIPNLALVNKSFFEPVIRHKYKSCGQHDYERVMKKCKAQERKLLYRNSIKVLRLEKSTLASHPARWAKLFDSLPNLKTVTYEEVELSKETNNDVCGETSQSKFSFEFSYSYSESLGMRTDKRIKRRVGIPNAYNQKMDYSLAIGPMLIYDLFVQGQNGNPHIQMEMKRKMLERIRFISNSPKWLTICVPFENSHLLDIYTKLIQEGFQTPDAITLTSCDESLPDLLEIIGGRLLFLSILTWRNEPNQLTFESLCERVGWERLEKLAFLNVSCTRYPPSDDVLQEGFDHDDHDYVVNSDTTTTTLVGNRKALSGPPRLSFFSLSIVYPVDIILSPIQLENEKRYIRQMAHIVYQLTIRRILTKLDQYEEMIRLLVLHSMKDGDRGPFRTAVFNDEFNKVFLEAIKEKIEDGTRKMEGRGAGSG
ncbi:hypothetical protein I204_01135 [Kwoniella mangroviensis CBS 8886]|nr:hypothetical protein I204_01135 [Kwoniella mangroviensis CBS 8886]